MPSKLKDHDYTLDGREIVAKAYARYVRCSARKVRYVVDAIRGKSVGEAEEILAFTARPSAVPHITKVLKAAVAAANQKGVNPITLRVGEVIVNDAPMMKRMRPASMGRAVRVRKRNSHIFLALTAN